jgi:hypothetical protein
MIVLLTAAMLLPARVHAAAVSFYVSVTIDNSLNLPIANLCTASLYNTSGTVVARDPSVSVPASGTTQIVLSATDAAGLSARYFLTFADNDSPAAFAPQSVIVTTPSAGGTATAEVTLLANSGLNGAEAEINVTIPQWLVLSGGSALTEVPDIMPGQVQQSETDAYTVSTNLGELDWLLGVTTAENLGGSDNGDLYLGGEYSDTTSRRIPAVSTYVSKSAITSGTSLWGVMLDDEAPSAGTTITPAGGTTFGESVIGPHPGSTTPIATGDGNGQVSFKIDAVVYADTAVAAGDYARTITYTLTAAGGS